MRRDDHWMRWVVMCRLLLVGACAGRAVAPSATLAPSPLSIVERSFPRLPEEGTYQRVTGCGWRWARSRRSFVISRQPFSTAVA